MCVCVCVRARQRWHDPVVPAPADAAAVCGLSTDASVWDRVGSMPGNVVEEKAGAKLSGAETLTSESALCDPICLSIQSLES